MVLRGTDGPILAPLAEGELLGGIRPESIRLAEHGIPALVGHAEYLGADTVLACSVGDVTMLARLPAMWLSTASVTSNRTPSRCSPVAAVLRRSCKRQSETPLAASNCALVLPKPLKGPRRPGKTRSRPS